MTVKRETAESFDKPSTEVLNAIAEILDRGQDSYKYVKTVEIEDNRFRTIIKPKFWPLLLSTKFEILVIPEGARTKVVAKTISQLLIMGDVFGFYNGYIRDLFEKLRT